MIIDVLGLNDNYTVTQNVSITFVSIIESSSNYDSDLNVVHTVADEYSGNWCSWNQSEFKWI